MYVRSGSEEREENMKNVKNEQTEHKPTQQIAKIDQMTSPTELTCPVITISVIIRNA